MSVLMTRRLNNRRSGPFCHCLEFPAIFRREAGPEEVAGMHIDSAMSEWREL